VAVVIDLATPWTAVAHSVRLPPHPAHLPERFGLFTLILLGESVVAVMKGIESQETWSFSAASAAIIGLATLFTMWWWYFDRTRAAGERHVRTHQDAVRVHIWSYAHFPLYLAIVIVGVGIQRVVATATHGAHPEDAVMWITAGALLVTAMTAISKNSAAHT